MLPWGGWGWKGEKGVEEAEGTVGVSGSDVFDQGEGPKTPIPWESCLKWLRN